MSGLCFAFVLCAIHMQSKDGTNTLAKDVFKQRTHSERLTLVLFFPAGLQRSKQQKIENKSYLSKWCHKYLQLVYFQPFLVDLFTGIDFRA